jgi:diguanylate cyclase (GGDEF)-like protein
MATPGTDAGVARGDAGALPVARADAQPGRPHDRQTFGAGGQTPGDRAQAVSDDDHVARDHELDSHAAFHTGAATTWGVLAKERFGVAHFRDERASWRDHAAQERDELAAGRDLEADGDDQTALALEGVDGLLDRGALGVGELRALGLAGRQRAALGRTRARRDRHLAAVDRELGERAREESKRDREQAGTDELTGAHRRGVGLQELQREIDRARRTGEGLVAAYVDVDGLQAVNDEHGHRAGDQLLRDIVEGLRREMRSYDLLVRVGGDEFVCVMPGVSADQARQRFEHLGSALAAGPTMRSVSFGLSELRDGDGAVGLVDRADQDLIAGRRVR